MDGAATYPWNSKVKLLKFEFNHLQPRTANRIIEASGSRFVVLETNVETLLWIRTTFEFLYHGFDTYTFSRSCLWKWILDLILQDSSRSTRFAHFCTARNSWFSLFSPRIAFERHSEKTDEIENVKPRMFTILFGGSLTESLWMCQNLQSLKKPDHICNIICFFKTYFLYVDQNEVCKMCVKILQIWQIIINSANYYLVHCQSHKKYPIAGKFGRKVCLLLSK